MPQGDKSAYSDKQKRKAEHIEEGYEDRGVKKGEAERRAWATVNKESGGGKKSGSGRGKTENHASSRKGGHLGAEANSSRKSWGGPTATPAPSIAASTAIMVESKVSTRLGLKSPMPTARSQIAHSGS